MIDETIDVNDITHPANGYYDIVDSPDDGGWYADLFFDRITDCPIFARSELAEMWARQHGGKRRLR